MINTKNKIKNKILGILAILLLLVFSTAVFASSISVLSVAAVYTIFLVRIVIIIYEECFGNINKKSLKIVKIIVLLIICIGFYFAYAIYYAELFRYKGYSDIQIITRIIPLLYKVDADALFGSSFFILFCYFIGILANKQFIKHLQVDEAEKRLIKLEKKIGVKYTNKDTSKIRNNIISLIVVGLLTIGLGKFNSVRFDKYAYYTKYYHELMQLKERSPEAYERAREVLLNQEVNHYTYSASEYYIRGEENTIYIYADFEDEDYTLYCDREPHGTTLTLTWGDWLIGDRGEYTVATLNVEARINGYSIIKITNDYNDEILYIFVDNFDYGYK